MRGFRKTIKMESSRAGTEKVTRDELHEVEINTIIIGASAAGLSCAACLTKKSIPYILLEKENGVAAPWRKHYDRLHLNTEKYTSSLPYLKFNKEAPVYPSRDYIVNYMEEYAARFNIQPLFHQEVLSVTKKENDWKVVTRDRNFTAKNVIIATGFNRRPLIPTWPGTNNFKGRIFHSSFYKNGAEYKGKKVLVVGFGNSACEISICLHEYGATPALSVKGAVNIVPRDAGSEFANKAISSLAFISKLFPEFVDKLNAPVLKKKYGDYGLYGLKKLPYGPNVQMIRHKRVPLLDIGTIELIKQGHIKVYPAIESFTESGVRFTNGVAEKFDAVILATGYTPSVADFINDSNVVTDERGRPVTSGIESGLPNLFFCGFQISPAGMLNEIGREAKRIAKLISRKE
jgi:cation diffusion facilitator CzcD-associated flavoprotein CzcO